MVGLETSWDKPRLPHHKEGWALKNWCFQTLELESPLDIKEIKPVNPKGNQPWIFTGRSDAEAEIPILWPPDAKDLTHWKRLWCWEGLRAGGEGDDRGWDGWMAASTRWTWVGWTPEVGDGQGGLACCDSWGCKESDTTERLIWSDLSVGLYSSSSVVLI